MYLDPLGKFLSSNAVYLDLQSTQNNFPIKPPYFGYRGHYFGYFGGPGTFRVLTEVHSDGPEAKRRRPDFRLKEVPNELALLRNSGNKPASTDVVYSIWYIVYGI